LDKAPNRATPEAAKSNMKVRPEVPSTVTGANGKFFLERERQHYWAGGMSNGNNATVNNATSRRRIHVQEWSPAVYAF